MRLVRFVRLLRFCIRLRWFLILLLRLSRGLLIQRWMHVIVLFLRLCRRSRSDANWRPLLLLFSLLFSLLFGPVLRVRPLVRRRIIILSGGRRERLEPIAIRLLLLIRRSRLRRSLIHGTSLVHRRSRSLVPNRSWRCEPRNHRPLRERNCWFRHRGLCLRRNSARPNRRNRSGL